VAIAQLVVRNIEDDVKERLQRRAKKHGCSLEELVRDILSRRGKGHKADRRSGQRNRRLCSRIVGV